jgi:hypothetical protein
LHGTPPLIRDKGNGQNKLHPLPSLRGLDIREISGLLRLSFFLQLCNALFNAFCLGLELLEILPESVDYFFAGDEPSLKPCTPSLLVTSAGATGVGSTPRVSTVVSVTPAPASASLPLLRLLATLPMMPTVFTATTFFIAVHLAASS